MTVLSGSSESGMINNVPTPQEQERMMHDYFDIHNKSMWNSNVHGDVALLKNPDGNIMSSYAEGFVDSVDDDNHYHHQHEIGEENHPNKVYFLCVQHACMIIYRYKVLLKLHFTGQENKTIL